MDYSRLKKFNTTRIPETVALFLFAAAYVLISVVHEPWFDEAQAWQIAKCASIREILFVLPHYEGHPPLWYLILAIPAKLGIPYELGLKTTGFLFSFAVSYLILFKAPYPLLVRLLLPFNYFIFYQYSVIVRPYGMLLLFLLLLAMAFPKRHQSPFYFVLVLALLCMTHSYGIVIAFGISLCYLWEILIEKGPRQFFTEFFRDKRTQLMTGLLVLAILQILEILPYDDIYVPSQNRTNPFFKCLLYTLFSMLPECFCTTMTWSNFDATLIQIADFYTGNLVSVIIVGLFIWAAIFCCSSKLSFHYFAVPYLVFAIFCAAVYFMSHHAGVALGVFLFWLWITLEDADRFAGWKMLVSKAEIAVSRVSLRAFAGIGVAFLLIPIYWTVSASILDVRLNYSYGRETASFLKTTGLDQALIFKAWYFPDNTLKTAFCTADPSVLAYFDHNLFANTNDGNKDQAYTLYVYYTPEQRKEKFEDWKKLGAPDVLVGYADISEVFGDEISIFDYSPVFLGRYETIFKNNSAKHMVPVLLRNDLLGQYDVEVQDVSEYMIGYYQVTDDMIEAYRNGEATIEDLVDMGLGSWGKS